MSVLNLKLLFFLRLYAKSFVFKQRLCSVGRRLAVSEKSHCCHN